MSIIVFMKISVVTISFNQASYIEDCIKSVLIQDYENYEHIIIDAGSNDQTLSILNKYKDKIKFLSEPDNGPADGLNKGFGMADGDIFFYLNSDDVVCEGAFREAVNYFNQYKNIDVLTGSAKIIDAKGDYIRRVWSDPITKIRLAYGGGIAIQPATFFKSSIFKKTKGFNIENYSNWDGELIIDMFLQGAYFKNVNDIWGGYRLHSTTITASAKLDDKIKLFNIRMRSKLGMSENIFIKNLYKIFFRFERLIRHPSKIYERFLNGKVYGRNS